MYVISNDCHGKTSKQHLTDRVHLARSQIGKTSAKLFWMDFPRQGNRVYTSAIMPFASRNQLVETLLEFHGESHWKLV